ncbi:hypothetical protein RO21_10750 [[Actinobacillus] muris]|uniref:DNA-binding protein n=1 Tax=Muribacter muris TaxID=67855 RepID=A0A0J5S157_9PAST|nr:DNA-binding protein [Muribacter muris]KMK50592.1 hypothetical protein RO21_10750 [[Actinobacillus] muris] [Muribacter muris]
MLQAKTPKQVKEGFAKQGKTLTQWAEENGYNRDYVYLVLNGNVKAKYGKAHEIAVKLGLKAAA